MRKILLFVCVFMIVFTGVSFAQAKIGDQLRNLIDNPVNQDQKIPIMVMFKDQYTFKDIVKKYKLSGDRDSINSQVTQIMQERASSDQYWVKELSTFGQKIGSVENFKAFWRVNIVAMEATPSIIQEIASYDNVDRIVDLKIVESTGERIEVVKELDFQVGNDGSINVSYTESSPLFWDVNVHAYVTILNPEGLYDATFTIKHTGNQDQTGSFQNVNMGQETLIGDYKVYTGQSTMNLTGKCNNTASYGKAGKVKVRCVTFAADRADRIEVVKELDFQVGNDGSINVSYTESSPLWWEVNVHAYVTILNPEGSYDATFTIKHTGNQDQTGSFQNVNMGQETLIGDYKVYTGQSTMNLTGKCNDAASYGKAGKVKVRCVTFADRNDRIQVTKELEFSIVDGSVNFVKEEGAQVPWTMTVYVYVQVNLPANGDYQNIKFTIEADGEQPQYGNIVRVGTADGRVLIPRSGGSNTWSIYPKKGKLTLTGEHTDAAATQGKVTVTVSTTPLD